MKGIRDAHLHCSLKGNHKQEQIKQLEDEMSRYHIQKGVLYLIDENDFTEKNYALDWGNHIIPGIMLDPNDNRADVKLEELIRCHFRLVKLLPYEQKLLYKDYAAVCRYTQKLQEYGMALTICGAYGSEYIYATNGVDLAERILREGFQNPLIIAHGGMVRILDVFSLMQEYQNLYMDLSFTIPFWWGSHVIQDLYFVMAKLNYERIFWGSDYPNHSFEEGLSKFDLFCETYQISNKNKQKILAENFNCFCRNYWEQGK